MNIGIVGAEGSKFSAPMEVAARSVIYSILSDALAQTNPVHQLAPIAVSLISGGCHLGGIDIWAEEIADELGIAKIIHKPRRQQWSGGYRERNLAIARDSDIVHCIVIAGYHKAYHGMKFASCYHCKTNAHVKSGGCYTALRAKRAEWHVIPVVE